MSGADLPTTPGGFGCILADPPWRFSTWSDKGRDRSPDGLSEAKRRRYLRNIQRSHPPQNHYQTMATADICDLQVAAVSAKDAILFLWIVDSMLQDALAVGEAWGFKYKCTGFIWAKGREGFSPKPALGYWTRKQAELCLIFTRGSPKRVSRGVEQMIFCPRGGHSAKPERQYDRIEALVGGPYLELFARRTRPGWASWGDQVGVRDGDLLEAAA